MRLTTLGGSAAGANSGAGCSGYLVDTGSERLVLDLGPGTLPELRRHADYRTLDALVISHLHLDHLLDLFALRFAAVYNPVPLPRRLPLWLPPGGSAFLAAAGAVFATPGEPGDFFGEAFDVREYDPAGSLAIGGATLRFWPTVHFVPCWAIRVADGRDGGDLAYTADTGPCVGVERFAAGAATLLAEGTSDVPPPEGAVRGHMAPEEAGAMAQEAGVATLVLTHLWEEHGLDAAAARAARAFTGRIEVARPGLVVEW
jgi:ribonuclease BN (tRNA processing enzyme)